jgi:hypothetical protein
VSGGARAGLRHDTDPEAGDAASVNPEDHGSQALQTIPAFLSAAMPAPAWNAAHTDATGAVGDIGSAIQAPLARHCLLFLISVASAS